MNMFKPSKAKTIKEYFSQVEDEQRRKALMALDRLIKKSAPELKPHFASNMLGYGSYHYRSRSGREGDWPVIALASQKNYLSFYACFADVDGYIAEKYKKELPKANIGKSCIRFKKLADVDNKVLIKIIKQTASAAKKMKYHYISSAT